MLSRKNQRKWERKGKNILMRSNKMSRVTWRCSSVSRWAEFSWSMSNQCAMSTYPDYCKGSWVIKLWVSSVTWGLPATKLCRVLNLSALMLSHWTLNLIPHRGTTWGQKWPVFYFFFQALWSWQGLWPNFEGKYLPGLLLFLDYLKG